MFEVMNFLENKKLSKHENILWSLRIIYQNCCITNVALIIFCLFKVCINTIFWTIFWRTSAKGCFWFLNLTTSYQNLISTKLKRLITHSFLFDKLSTFMSFIASKAISKIHFSKQAIRNICDIVMQLFPMKKVKI